jgi:hypothetical protein
MINKIFIFWRAIRIFIEVLIIEGEKTNSFFENILIKSFQATGGFQYFFVVEWIFGTQMLSIIYQLIVFQ